MNYPASVESVGVDDAEVYIHRVTLSPEEQARLHKMHSDVEGIVRIEIVTDMRNSQIILSNFSAFLCHCWGYN